MVKFAQLFPDEQIVATLSPQLGWSHFKELLHLDPELKRNFYAEMCRIEGWSVRLMARAGSIRVDRGWSCRRRSFVVFIAFFLAEHVVVKQWLNSRTRHGARGGRQRMFFNIPFLNSLITC